MPVDTVTHRRPDLFDETTHSLLSDYIVIVFDNEYNTWEEVIGILQKATGCSLEEAEMETWEGRRERQVIWFSPMPPSPIGIRVFALSRFRVLFGSFTSQPRPARSQVQASVCMSRLNWWGVS